MFEATRQGGVFLTMVYAGLLCGVLYDVLRLIRRMLRAGRLLSAATDLVFWLGAADVCVHALVRTIHEPVRIYALLGAGCGMSLYLLGVSEMLYTVIEYVLRKVTWVQERCKKHRKKAEQTKKIAEK